MGQIILSMKEQCTVHISYSVYKNVFYWYKCIKSSDLNENLDAAIQPSMAKDSKRKGRFFYYYMTTTSTSTSISTSTSSSFTGMII